MLRPALATSCLLLLAACASGPDAVGSVAGGDCQVAHTPQYAVRGATRYDQQWVDTTTEALVAGCRQPRPQARPPELDRPAARQAVKPTPKKKRFLDRLHRAPTS